MYNELNKSIVSGSREAKQLGSGSSKELRDIVQQLQSTSADLARSVVTLGTNASAIAAAGGNDVSEEEDTAFLLAQTGDYNAAFERAVSSSDVALLTKLCENVDRDVIFVSPSPVSNIIRLCMLQQLASDLNASTMTKLAWMQQLTLSLDRDDTQIADHVGMILQQVLTQIQGSKAAVDATGDATTMTTHVVLCQVLQVFVGQTRAPSPGP
jgi:hypothetical protein